MDDTHAKVTIELDAEQALVLFDLLARWSDLGVLSIRLEHRAEQRVLWDVLATLESVLVEPLLPDYRDRLNEARNRIQDEG
ncbi:MAG TPA: hypothetical protein VIC27_01295 [Ktedonobacterales bacterium]